MKLLEDNLLVAVERTRERLLAERCAQGHWEGRLATSALSTATSVIALSLNDAARYEPLICRGLDWLAANANADGGWGDTTASKSNINTTALGWAAFGVTPRGKADWTRASDGAARWLQRDSGELSPEKITRTILAFYGDDRTFSTPILSALTLCGRLGERAESFARIPQLPFEMAATPHNLWRLLRLPVVSYAMPALVAVGQVRHHYAPSRNSLARAVRNRLRERTLAGVRSMQPSSGGFLEAVPLTSFVVACLSGVGRREHPIVRDGIRFILDLVRDDGGWPIDTCLSTWVTTLAVTTLQVAQAQPGSGDTGIGGSSIRHPCERPHGCRTAADGDSIPVAPVSPLSPADQRRVAGRGWTATGPCPMPTTRPGPCWRCGR